MGKIYRMIYRQGAESMKYKKIMLIAIAMLTLLLAAGCSGGEPQQEQNDFPLNQEE